uniref:glycerophosphodiester phosphodiesterase n=1 Tax=Alistipes sp. TaxID=1872444 RepID=UPI0040576A2C
MKKTLTLLMAVIIGLTASAQYKAPQIIAHRGFHKAEGAAKNSLNALKAAQEAKFWGSEFDVNLTNDEEMLVVHGPWHPSPDGKTKVHVNISNKADIQALPLTSGEIVPTLDEFLQQGKLSNDTKLIVEVKNQLTPQLETKLVEKIVAKIAEYGLQDNVEYIAFRPWVCIELARVTPEGTRIAYLNGDYTPVYCKSMGCTGIDYKFSKLKKNAAWIKYAHKLGMTVNVWTVNKEEDIRWCIQKGVDYITTDDPMLVKSIIEEMCGTGN